MEKQREIAEILQALSDANNGKLTPEQVLQAAKDPESPLHDQFVWDDQKAAHKQRLDTARHLIRSVKYFFKKETLVIKVPIYVRDPELEKKEQGYVDVRTIKSDDERRRDILIDEFKRVQGVFERATELAVYFKMEDRLEDMQRHLRVMVAELSGETGRA